MNKKLRLLVTGRCENRCTLCCNNRFNLNRLESITITEVVQQYEEINITGGNPLSFPILKRVEQYIRSIRNIEKYGGLPKRTVYVYTNTCNVDIIANTIIDWPIDGITITPHSEREFNDFVNMNNIAKISSIFADARQHMSFRLNVMEDLQESIDKLTLWEGFKVKSLVWIKDCPIPADEDFKRIPILL